MDAGRQVDRQVVCRFVCFCASVFAFQNSLKQACVLCCLKASVVSYIPFNVHWVKFPDKEKQIGVITSRYVLCFSNVSLLFGIFSDAFNSF